MDNAGKNSLGKGDSHLLFRRGDTRFYIPTLAALEIGRLGAVTPWSEKSAYLCGTAIVHGNATLVIDVLPLLVPDLPSECTKQDELLAVCVRGEEASTICVIVDEVLGIESLTAAEVRQIATPIVTGFHTQHNARSVPILNIAGICGSVMP